MSGSVPPGGADDRQRFLAELVTGVGRALPGAEASGVLVVARDRSLGDRIAGRPGSIARLRLRDAREVLTLAPAGGGGGGGRGGGGGVGGGGALGGFLAEVERVSGGVTIARRTLPVGEWLTALAGRVAAIAAETTGDARSAAVALGQLGIPNAAADLRVDEPTLEPDLRALPALLEGRLPPDALATLRRITTLLLDAVPRVAGRGEAEATVLRAATVYLPDTVRAYLTLPPDWAEGHEFTDHSTPAAQLQRQLALLETSVAEVRDAAIADDAAALLTNGRFLAARFTPPRLDLH
ncbi:hypothetical protein [Subtercola boreus]|uniref:hypothetical protein n=1 Tax=Subtercola boreus TaxID=120213 RepID=UPI0011C0792B|nr:hypothetical protein [Subtercola boreus]